MDDKRIGIGERKLAAQRLKKLFLSNYKFNLVRTQIYTDLHGFEDGLKKVHA